MQRPSLRQLEYAVALADHLSFRVAAQACFVTQPALSSQLRELETLLGTRLFERDSRSVRATAAGTALVQGARQALATVDAACDAARGFADPLAGPLRLGVIPTIAPYFLPRALAGIAKRFPRLELKLREEPTPRLVSLVATSQLDLGLVALEADLGGLAELALFVDPFVVAAPAGHPLAAKKRVGKNDLADERLLLLDDPHCLRQQALDVCARRKAIEAVDLRASSLSTLVQMVSSGAGLTLLPSLSLEVEAAPPRKLVILPFADPKPARTIGLVWRKGAVREGGFRKLGAYLRERAP
jgi:LysR family hydrogen peroxide-inducible transcriptional activator